MLLLNTKDDILKDSGNQIILVTSDFHFMDKKHILFYVLQKKENDAILLVKVKKDNDILLPLAF